MSKVDLAILKAYGWTRVSPDEWRTPDDSATVCAYELGLWLYRVLRATGVDLPERRRP